MPVVRIPSPLRPYAGGQADVAVEGDTAGQVLEDLTRRYPYLRQHLFAGAGELRAFVNFYINQDDIRHLQGLNTPVNEGDRLMIVPSVAGG